MKNNCAGFRSALFRGINYPENITSARRFCNCFFCKKNVFFTFSHDQASHYGKNIRDSGFSGCKKFSGMVYFIVKNDRKKRNLKK